MLTLSSAYGVVVTPSSINDGYFHDEVGSSYDYFDSTSTVNNASYMFWGTSDTLSYNRAFIQFSISGLAHLAGSTATLNIYIINSYLTGTTPDAGSIKHVSNASNANGNASQKLYGDVVVSTVAAGLSGWLSIDVTSYIESDLNNGYNYSCFSFEPNTTGDYSNRDAGFSFYTADSSNYKPYLVVPEPSTYAAMLGCGALALAALKRRKS